MFGLRLILCACLLVATAARADGEVGPAGPPPAEAVGPEAEAPAAEATSPLDPADQAVAFAGLQGDAGIEDSNVGLTALIVEHFERVARVHVVVQSDVQDLLANHAERLTIGCPDDSCGDEVVSLLRGLEAPLLLVGRLSRVGTRVVLQLSLLDTAKGRARSRVTTEAEGLEPLRRKLPEAVGYLSDDAGLLRPRVGRDGSPLAVTHLIAKLGSGISGVNSDLFRLSNGLRVDFEGGWFFHPKWAAFAEFGLALGKSGQDSELVRLRILPVSAGIKRVWQPGRTRLWVGGAIGSGLVRVVQGGQGESSGAFALGVVGGFDYRMGRRFAFGLDFRTSLTSGILQTAADVSVPLLVGVTGTAGVLFF